MFNPNGNNGFNVEHFRDFNNAGPTVAVGFETQPGHQASNNRGEYRFNFCGDTCPSVGVTTYGGTGVYGAKIGGVWDALLGEGRNWFFYASSDWHNRGEFSIYETGSTNDFYPGEYQKLYIPRPAGGTTLRPEVVVDGVRSGNSYSVMGDLITGELSYKAEVIGYAAAGTAKMGQTLVVPRGRSVRLTLEVTLPTGTNHSPYSFNNPSLAPLGIQEPLNRPKLRNVDFIRGNVTGVVSPNSGSYTNGTNPTAQIIGSFNQNNWTVSGQKRTMVVNITERAEQHVRPDPRQQPAAEHAERDRRAGQPAQRLGSGEQRPGSVRALHRRRVPVAHGRAQRSEAVELRRRRVGGSVVLHQPDLHPRRRPAEAPGRDQRRHGGVAEVSGVSLRLRAGSSNS